MSRLLSAAQYNIHCSGHSTTPRVHNSHKHAIRYMPSLTRRRRCTFRKLCSCVGECGRDRHAEYVVVHLLVTFCERVKLFDKMWYVHKHTRGTPRNTLVHTHTHTNAEYHVYCADKFRCCTKRRCRITSNVYVNAFVLSFVLDLHALSNVDVCCQPIVIRVDFSRVWCVRL